MNEVSPLITIDGRNTCLWVDASGCANRQQCSVW